MSFAAAAGSAYKRLISPVLHAGLGGACRFQPTCSEYATLAVSEFGWLHGGALALWRLLRCHPAARGGWDPVRPRRSS
jgi:putative membrane protein insertion efficiency factor